MAVKSLSAVELLQYLGFEGSPTEKEMFGAFRTTCGFPLPRQLPEFLSIAAASPVLHNIALWVEPKWYRTLYEAMEEQLDPEDSTSDYAKTPREKWPETLPNRLLIGSEGCGLVRYGIALGQIAVDDPEVAWNYETAPVTQWHNDWLLSEFLLALVCDLLLGRPDEAAADLLAEQGWRRTLHRDGEQALDAFGIDPARLRKFRSLYRDPEDDSAFLACCIADEELCIWSCENGKSSLLALTRRT